MTLKKCVKCNKHYERKSKSKYYKFCWKCAKKCYSHNKFCKLCSKKIHRQGKNNACQRCWGIILKERYKNGKHKRYWKDKKRSKETNEKIRRSHLGYKFSEEAKKKMSIAKIGTKRPDMVGEKHWFWNDGSSFEPYTKEWTIILKEQIRKRDVVCMFCFKSHNGKAHSVHHIDYDKKNCNPGNLITLCNKCHVKTNLDRNHWTKFFNLVE